MPTYRPDRDGTGVARSPAGSAVANVIVADDETLLRWALGQRLSRDGHVVSEAMDGATALDLLAVVSPPTVVVLDVKLPDMSGLAVLEEIGRRRPDAAVVMMTAYWAAGALEQARRLGARALLAKPVDLDQVAAAVDEALHTPLRGDARC
jgi:DNA-binding NtrC family response regulator